MLKILLIDDDILEKEILENVLEQNIAREAFSLEHVYKCSEAISYLIRDKYDLVLLDNMLAASISGKFSVPVIQQYLKAAPLVIISNDISADYLSNPDILGVQDVIDKAKLSEFLQGFFSDLRHMSDAPPPCVKEPPKNTQTAA